MHKIMEKIARLRIYSDYDRGHKFHPQRSESSSGHQTLPILDRQIPDNIIHHSNPYTQHLLALTQPLAIYPQASKTTPSMEPRITPGSKIPTPHYCLHRERYSHIPAIYHREQRARLSSPRAAVARSPSRVGARSVLLLAGTSPRECARLRLARVVYSGSTG